MLWPTKRKFATFHEIIMGRTLGNPTIDSVFLNKRCYS